MKILGSNAARGRPAWLARVLIGVVCCWNAQCAVAFLAWPAAYAPGFELVGPAGAAVVRGMGLLFLMWNVPYLVALVNPVRHRTSLGEAVAMQAIGLAGESLIFWSMAGGHPVARSTILRFAGFDGAGLLLLLLAMWTLAVARRAADVPR